MKDEYMIYKLSDSIKSTSHIDNELFVKHNVKIWSKASKRKTDTALKKRPFSFFQVFYRIKTNWKHLPVCLTNLCL